MENINVTLTRPNKGSITIQIKDAERGIIGQFLGDDVTAVTASVIKSPGVSAAKAPRKAKAKAEKKPRAPRAKKATAAPRSYTCRVVECGAKASPRNDMFCSAHAKDLTKTQKAEIKAAQTNGAHAQA